MSNIRDNHNEIHTLDISKTKRIGLFSNGSYTPIERLELFGVDTLSVSELLALLIGTGSSDKNVFELVAEMLDQPFFLDDLRVLRLSFLTKYNGVGRVKACRILAGIELGRRLFHIERQNLPKRIRNSRDVYELIKSKSFGLQSEKFWLIGVDSCHRPIFVQTLALGGKSQVQVDIRSIFSMLLRSESVGFFCIHNHPSGSCSPSPEDIELTYIIVELSTKLGIQFLDHLIVSDRSYYSFADRDQSF
ncbi:MAG: hypothetical protein KDD52_09825 [Bdellovibrionales bacterium]|nr:hypothetical protein [Bdellovibrionales bacterium]